MCIPEAVPPECTAEPPPGDEYVLADHLFDYDGFGNLTREVQSHGAPAAQDSPAISYEWDFAGASAGNRNRLAAMTYPKPALEGGGREVSFVYGQPASLDDALDRVTKIDDDGWGELAKYSYMGLSRRVALMLAGVVTHSVAAGGGGAGYPGLDRFGRLVDLHYQLNAQDTIHRYQYGYDLAGNRTFARITQAATRALDGNGQPIEPPQWVPHVNDRSWLYAYDGLNRLIDAGLGSLDDFNAGLLSGGTGLPGGGTAPVPGTTEWSLDNLGNWAGGALGGGGPPVSVVMAGDFDGDGTADDDRTLHHDVNLRNQITALTEQGESGGPVVHDPAGNVVLHGGYYCQFDALNRLVQVNLLGEAQVDAEDGRIASGALGDLVAQYMYDGLGRLMAKRTPERLGSPKLQTKDFYYDGVRRVMEVITRHGVPPEPGRNDELKEPQREGEGGSGEDGGEGGGEGGGEDPPGLPPLPVIEQWTDREYVYGPDYVDEFVAQFDRDGRPMLMLQDGNFNVVALLAGADDVFFDASTNGLPAGSVLEQYVHDPYGSVRQADSFAEHAVNRVGHQGLFFDRFDGTADDPSLTRDAQGVYYNRNRVYSPTLGRFLTADPNETALTLVSALAMNGQSLGAPDSGGLNLEGHYGDGLNLYQYLGSNPANDRDPLGLDVWDDFDDAIGTHYFTQDLATLVTISAEMQIRSGARLAQAYALAAFGWGDLVWDESEQALFSTLMGPFGSRVCFPAGTLVVMADGSRKPIQEIQPGDLVLCDFDPEQDNGSEVSAVDAIFMRKTHTIAALCVWDSVGNHCLLTTPDHPFYSCTTMDFVEARDLADTPCRGDSSRAYATVSFDSLSFEAAQVYNLQVHGAHTYYVAATMDSAPILVHNTCYRRLGRLNNAIGHSFEMAVMAMKNIPKYTGKKLRALGTNFVPDFLYNGMIGDIKSSDYVYMTAQLRAIAAYAKANGLYAVLYVAGTVSAEVAKNFRVIVVP